MKESKKSSKISKYILPLIESNMYMIVENDEALAIDSCISKKALEKLKKHGVKKLTIILTHEHLDHISGVNWFRENISCEVTASEECMKNIGNADMNLSSFSELFFTERNINRKVKPYVCSADRCAKDRECMKWQGHTLEFVMTPGHSQGSMCIIFDNDSMFSGDTLVYGNKIITKLPGGSKMAYKDVTLPFLNSLPKDFLIYPGHGKADKLSGFEF